MSKSHKANNHRTTSMSVFLVPFWDPNYLITYECFWLKAHDSSRFTPEILGFWTKTSWSEATLDLAELTLDTDWVDCLMLPRRGHMVCEDSLQNCRHWWVDKCPWSLLRRPELPQDSKWLALSCSKPVSVLLSGTVLAVINRKQRLEHISCCSHCCGAFIWELVTICL